MKEKETKIPKPPKAPKEPKVKKSNKITDPDYIGRPKPMKTKKFEFHKPTTKFYVGLGIWVVVIAFIAYLAVRLANVGSSEYVSVLRYEFKEAAQPESYVMENNDLLFTLDPFTTRFTVEQKSTGKIWYSNPPDAQNDKLALAKEKQNMQSPFLLKYSTENGVDTIYDFYSSSVQKKVYQISQNGNEITVDYSIGEIEQIYLYPMAITEKDMDKWLDKLSTSDQRAVKSNYRRLEKGTFLPSDNEAQLMKDYPMLANEAVYVIRDNVQNYLKERNEKIFASIGYTYEDYQHDLEIYAGAKAKNVPGFNVTVVYKLEGDTLSVNVPFDKIAYKKDYPIIRLSILPYFGAGGLEDTGFMLVPEGGGSIVNFNNGKTRQNSYYADIYGWDYATDRKAVITETRSAFPVFGISSGDSSFISIIANGAEYAGVNADVSGRMGSYNYVYAEYKMLHAEQYEASSRNINTQYAYERGLPQDESICQVYKFIDGNTYVDMAKSYRDYLFGGKKSLKNKDVPVAVEIVGAVDKMQQVFGIPKTLPYKLTSYSEAGDIIKQIDELGIDNVYYKLSGFINEGVRQKMLSKFKLISNLGGTGNFKKMMKTAKDVDAKIYLDGTVQNSNRTGVFGGFNRYKHPARFVSSELCELSEYSPIWYGKLDTRDTYYLLRPDVTQQMVNVLSKNASKYGAYGISFRDHGNLLSSDFNVKRRVSRVASRKMQQESFSQLQEKNLGIMVNAGNDYSVKYADFVTNMVMHGNDYAILDQTVPFYQIALHGNVNFAGTAINLSPENKQGILEAAEAGSALFFTFIHEKEKALQDTYYTEYFASNFENWKSRLDSIYSEYNNNMAGVINELIEDHVYLSPDVTVTTFENGSKVYVNFGYTDFTTADGITISRRDYKVMGAK